MPGLSASVFATPAPARRSWSAIATSATLHLAVLAGIALLAGIAPAPAPPQEYRPVTFVMMPPLPVPHQSTLPLRLTAAIATHEPEHPVAVAIARPEPPPAPMPIARSAPGAAPPEPVRPTPLTIAPAPTPARPRAPVTVGLFAESAPTVHEAEPTKTVHPTGFDVASPTAKAGDTKSAAAVGGFDAVAPGPPARGARQGAVVAATGFGTGSSSADAVSRKTVAEVRPSGSDAAEPAAPPVRLAPLAERVDVPVEILCKPTPAYTPEARALKLEGEVLLDVEFAASGSVAVLQVVRGLGHGLDEAAATATKQIRFKPAQTAGRAITFRTTVHIVFRLA